MKKNLILLPLILFLFSCSNEESILSNDNSLSNKMSIRTIDEAISIADEIMALESGNSRSKATVKKIDILGSSNSRNSQDTLIYIVNYEDDGGYVLVSAAKNGIDVIGFSDNGNFDIEESLENENLSYYIENAKNYIKSLAILDPFPNPGSPKTMTSYIAIRVPVQWGQTYPEGIFCPNKIAGCAQTAMAQMMTYIKSPNQIILTYPEKDTDVQILDWEKICKHNKSLNTNNNTSIDIHLNECESDLQTHYAIGRLCRELGHLNNSTYNASSTSTATYNVWNTFHDLLPNNEISDFMNFDSDFSNLYKILESNQCVAFVEGHDINNGGHGWVCDGGKDIQTTYTFKDINGNDITTTEHDYYYHFNWGWNGNSDGFYAAGVFKPTSQPFLNFNTTTRFFVIFK